MALVSRNMASFKGQNPHSVPEMDMLAEDKMLVWKYTATRKFTRLCGDMSVFLRAYRCHASHRCRK